MGSHDVSSTTQGLKKKRNRALYKASPAAKASDRRKNAARATRCRDWINTIKTESGCVDCGYRENACALQFDHLPGQPKSGTIARMVASRPREVILAEIAKCEVVCANCHCIRTKSRHPVREWPPAKLPANPTLDDQRVSEILHRYLSTPVTRRDLAAEYGVCSSAIGSILCGQNWRHVEPELRAEVRALALERGRQARAATGTPIRHTKLREDDVRAIRARHAGGETRAALAREFAVTWTQVHYIVNRRAWTHID